MIAAEVLVVALPIVGILLPIALLVASSKVGGSQPPALDQAPTTINRRRWTISTLVALRRSEPASSLGVGSMGFLFPGGRLQLLASPYW